jgi:hypothetical protein
VPTSHARRELLSPLQDVWQVLAEPYHLADWWPGLGAVEPDRRGVAAGARWQVQSRGATLLRGAQAEDVLLVTVADPMQRLAFEFVRAKMRADLEICPAGPATTDAELTVTGPLVLVFSRNIAKDALARLHDLCQTGSAF